MKWVRRMDAPRGWFSLYLGNAGVGTVRRDEEGAVGLTDSVRPPGSEMNRPYYPAFDGIRAVAIVAVFVDHYSVLTYGREGVCIFFVLSGFLITGVLLRLRGQVGAWKTFYMRRTLRIFPLYWGFWAVMLCLTGVLHLQWNRGNLLYLPYAGNYLWSFFGDRNGAPAAMVHLGFDPDARGVAQHFLFVGHFWTLAVEEQFYLFWPLLILRPRRVETVVRLCVGTILVVFCAKLGFAFLSPGFPNQIIRVTFLRCDEFAAGGLVAALLFLGKGKELARWANWILAGGAASLILACVVTSELTSALGIARWDFLVNLPATDLFAVGLILAGMSPTGSTARLLSWRPLVLLGRISYGFYVFHEVGHLLIRDFVEREFAHRPDALRDAMTAIIGFGVALICSVLSFRYLETPFLKLKNRWPAKGAVANRRKAAGAVV